MESHKEDKTMFRTCGNLAICITFGIIEIAAIAVTVAAIYLLSKIGAH
jgi:hypothetical protein